MTAPIPFGPCQQWVTAEDLGTCVDGATPDEIAAAARLATRMMFLLSGKKWSGVCDYEEHPCAGLTCGPGPDGRWLLWGLGYVPAVPVHLDGGWQNIPIAGGACRVDCIRLPGPVSSLTVWVDGQVLTEGVDYRLTGWRDVCRMNHLLWPVNSDPMIAKEDPGSFAFVFTRGNPIPQVAKDMAIVYGRRRILPMVCEQNCAQLVQEGLSSASADGISLNFQDMLGADPFKTGTVGIGIVDEWLRAENPRNRRGRTMRVYRADDPNRRTRRYT